MAKKSNKKAASKASKKESKPRITMEDLEGISDESDSELPPEDTWDNNAKALKEAIVSGQFDHLLDREDGGEVVDDESIEEVELNDDDDDDEEENDVEDEDDRENDTVEQDAGEEDDDEEGKENEDRNEDEDEEQDMKRRKNTTVSDESNASDEDLNGDDEEEDDNEGGNDKDDDDDDEPNDAHGRDVSSVKKAGGTNSRALKTVTQKLQDKTKGWAWAETFTIVPSEPLPFNDPESERDPQEIHDDLKREVAFYDMALAAVQVGRVNCKEASIPFSRPEDFFVEMVKSDGKLLHFEGW